MQTLARPTIESSAHWYDPKTGEPKHFIERSDGDGQRPTTIRDARKFGWVPSPTSILKVLDKPQLNTWKTEMACLAVLTAPRKDGEALDAFVERVLHTERQQDEQAAAARDLGTRIHAGIEAVLRDNQPPEADIYPFVIAACDAMRLNFGEVESVEQVIVGDRCAGKYDALFSLAQKSLWTVVDVKTTSNPPMKGSWLEHKLQLSFYADALSREIGWPIQTANVYVSTKQAGVVTVDIHDDWRQTYERGFRPLLGFWMFANNYDPAGV